jgi:hypothetical protein
MPDGSHRVTGARSYRRAARSSTQNGLPAYLTPRSVADVREFAELIAAAEWAPACYRGSDGTYVVEKIALGIMHGAAVGLGPFASVHAIAVIDGHPTIWGDGALALVERSGLVEDMREDYTQDGEEGLTAICTMRRRPWPTPITRRFSIAMAEEAGLTQKEGPWQTYPRRMLMMRARSWALRDGFADVLRGLSIREEVEDYDHVTMPLPEPAVARSPDRSSYPARRSIPRPRFADYLARGMAAGNGNPGRRPTIAPSRSGAINDCGLSPTGDAGGVGNDAGLTPCSRTAARVLDKERVGSPLTATDSERGVGGEQASAGIREGAPDCDPCANFADQPTVGETEPLAVIENTGEVSADEPMASETYALIDAEGVFIEVESVKGLREAFDRLFADPHLSADEVLGLWDSNEAAREELERAFGANALVEADCRREEAEQERDERVSVGPMSSKPGTTSAVRSRRHKTEPIVSARSSRRHTAESEVSAADTGQQLTLDPSSSDDELFEQYHSSLVGLKRRRVKAETFIGFRDANREIEDRLREGLSQRIAEIDAVYAWAARHTR